MISRWCLLVWPSPESPGGEAGTISSQPKSNAPGFRVAAFGSLPAMRAAATLLLGWRYDTEDDT